MRLPYIPSPLPASFPTETHAIHDRIAERRAPRPLLTLDTTLLHSPPVASGWNSFLGAIRTQTLLDPAFRELAICRVAVLNRAGFEWEDHEPIAKSEGVGEEALRACLEVKPTARGFGGGKERGGSVEVDEEQWGAKDRRREFKGGEETEEEEEAAAEENAECAPYFLNISAWTPSQKLIIAYTDAMTLSVNVPPSLFRQVKDMLSEGLSEEEGNRRMVELTGTVAAYNCVSRFLVALDVGEWEGREIGGERGGGKEG